MEVSSILSYFTYLEHVPDDIKVILMYKLLDSGKGWEEFMDTSALIKRAVSKEQVIKDYLKSRYPSWYDILINIEDINIDEDLLRKTYDLYTINKYFLVYLVLIKNDSLRHIADLFKFDDSIIEYYNTNESLLKNRYIQNVFGRYILEKNFPALYDYIKHIDISSLKGVSQDALSLFIEASIKKNVRTWLQLCAALVNLPINTNRKTLYAIFTTGIIPRDYILTHNLSHQMGLYSGFVYHFLLSNKHFNIEMQSLGILEDVLYTIFSLDPHLCEETITHISKVILHKIISNIEGALIADIRNPHSEYKDFIKFLLYLS